MECHIFTLSLYTNHNVSVHIYTAHLHTYTCVVRVIKIKITLYCSELYTKILGNNFMRVHGISL